VPQDAPPLARDFEGVLPEARTLAWLAWPISLTLLTNVGMGTVDTLLIGRLGEDALAALGQANIWTWSIATLARGTLRSLEATLTQATGAGDRERARAVFSSGLGAALALSIPVTVFYLLAGEGLRLLGQPARQIPLATAYCVALAPSVVPRMIEVVVQIAVNARGRTRPPFVATLIGNALNVVLAIVLIYGIGPFHGWGVVGAGIATTIAGTAESAILLWLVWDEIEPLWPSWRRLVELAPIVRTIRSGMFLGVQAAVETAAFMAAGVMVGWTGSTNLAGHTIAFNVGLVAYMIPFGIATATSVRIGNLVGAGRRWGRAAAFAVAFGTAASALAMLVFVSVPSPIARLFTKDVEVALVAAMLLPLCGAFQLFDGIQTVAQGVLRALGDFAVPALLNVVGFWLVGLPVGWLLAFPGGLGPRGVWIGLSAGLFATAVLQGIRVWRLQRSAQIGSQRQSTRLT
jgi:multidrug resistance protein, MATE family